ncbi:Protein FAM177A1 [Habropoda laboriosa]|uniref:Protein FAM177A1 n=1 Tax=Habropoda laboriosa TaxID=597456 RepID=A0A0L7R065_9HYME|nr:PREDICTED: protein FAM177A1 [Habropoda laboriosa]KOC64233.1 Protein FAM177A1 [Habropoda laboriosa]
MEPERIEQSDLSEVILNENTDTNTQDRKSLRRPKRVLHFSDGDLEEYSDDDTDTPETNKAADEIDPKTLTWLPWAWHRTTYISGKLLDGCDCVGEWLASFFGITAPKYQFEINEFYRLQALENEMQHKQDLEMAGWTEPTKTNLVNNV